MNEQQLAAIRRAQAALGGGDDKAAAQRAAIQRAMAKAPEKREDVVAKAPARPEPRQTLRQPTMRSAPTGPLSDVMPSSRDYSAEELRGEDMRSVAGVTPEREAPYANSGHAAEIVTPSGERMVFNPQTGQYTNADLLAGGMKFSALEAAGAGASQGLTFGAADEVAAMGDPMALERQRAAMKAAQRDHPTAYMTGEIGGAVSLPVGAVKGAKTIADAIWKGAKAGGVWSALYSFNQSSGGAGNRAIDAAKGFAQGFAVGGIAPIVLTGAARTLSPMFKRAERQPFIENLRATKNAAYRLVDSLDEKFQPDDINRLVTGIESKLDDANYVGGFGQQVDIQLARLQKLAGRNAPVSLGALDDIRSRLWKAYSKASDEVEILDMIEAIDELIDVRATASDAMRAARTANAAYKKAEMLDMAFQKAADQTNSTGSGGNILNKYRQAVTAIVNNPRQAKWFKAEEIEAMRKFLQGSVTENVMRRIGKLAPGGNGLMLALNIGAAAVDPAMLGVSALSAGAKEISDRAAGRGAEALIRRAAGAPALPAAQKAPVTLHRGISGYLGSR